MQDANSGTRKITGWETGVDWFYDFHFKIGGGAVNEYK